ncbi:MAG: type II toxin-antitoxin system RelE/ParE family toxin [Chitinophagaceae bacterium]|jgi:plasmid stabilization system protein ParE|nr:type II toxin-antitoxin system RelE/ParE family toxin [Chitinophagaceae bacterium]
MEKEIVWTSVSKIDFWDIIAYLKENWDEAVLNKFQKRLDFKIKLIQAHPNIGVKSSTYSKYRKTLITKHYSLIYTVSKNHIVIHRLKHTAMK